MLLIAIVIALVWWGAALWLRGRDVIPVWRDQAVVFMPAARVPLDPFSVDGYYNPPWTALLLAPLGQLPLELALLIQTVLTFVLLTAVVYRFGGGQGAALLALTSFLAFDNALELNVDWLVCVGLVVPPVWSAPFIVIKPQLALGYYAGLPPRTWWRAGGVLAVVLTLSLLVWGVWFDGMFRASILAGQAHNMAPRAHLPAVLAFGLGVVGLGVALRRRDPLVGMWAWLCFVPYITFYSLLLPYTLLAVRHPRVALIVTLALWLVYGGLLVPVLVR